MLAHEVGEHALDQFATVIGSLVALRLLGGLKLFLRGRERLLEEAAQFDGESIAAEL